jgi:hypothetical protein
MSISTVWIRRKSETQRRRRNALTTPTQAHFGWNRENRKLMNKTNQSQHRHGPDSDGIHHGFHRPYWKHAHHDWRLWIAVSLMLLAVTIYVMSDDLALRPRSQPQQAPSGAVKK